MRRIKTLVLCLLLVVTGAGAVEARSGVKRVEESQYTAGGVEGVAGLSAQGQQNLGAVRFQGGPERLVGARVKDASGRSILAEVVQLAEGQAEPLVSRLFCGKTERSVRILPHRYVYVYVYFGRGCGGEVLSAPTTGTVTAVFSGS